ncbi:putative receptor-like protein kinase At4g00960 [Cynara cardunculus var. scolymus]|uniref:putative receptor-like protein kinase At4g00960 n=1 Tax=Cynara cardunculus var. scolymus TaxID=59895 RepID=UPI000D62F72B|nr:putative receptor-like protein kinase At4g00960 [Cynara cardunculus var. scolymus]
MTKSNSFFHKLVKPFKFNPTKEIQQVELEKIAAQEQKIFSFQTLVSATKNFHPDNKLGQGGYGPVFKGKLEDGREIAVKKLSQSSSQGKKEFINEAKLLARVQHRNVVSLLGFCGNPEKLLVYEYVVHESLDKHLFKSANREVLDWKRRYDIIVGVARGLLYLHEDSHDRIIHRDIKASNILLDNKWIPKIADFGMARLYPEEQSHVNTRVAGTNGYMAPEYVMHGNLSVKVDVYSFGVVVLELVSGEKNSAFNLDPECQNLLDWAYKQYKKGKSLEILESSLASSADLDQVSACIQIGLLCTQSDPQQRPTMRRVVVMLTRKTGALDEPSRPGYPGTRYRRSRRLATSSSMAGTSGASSSESSTIATSSTTMGTSSTSAFVVSNSRSSLTTTTAATGTAALGDSSSVPDWKLERPFFVGSTSDPHGKRPMEIQD